MINGINNLDDSFFDEDFVFTMPNIVEITDENEFKKSDDNNLDDVLITDEEFESLLRELGIDKEKKSATKSNDLNLSDFEIEKQLVSSRLQLESELLNYERTKFEREKLEWEESKKLSEKKFQAQKEEFERYKKLEKEKIYLETKELIDSCTNLKEFLENYKKIHDVSE